MMHLKHFISNASNCGEVGVDNVRANIGHSPFTKWLLIHISTKMHVIEGLPIVAIKLEHPDTDHYI